MEKIVVFTPTLNIGGIERILLTYAKGLAEKGYDVTYLTLLDKGDFDFEFYENLKYEKLGVNRLRNSLFALIRFFKQVKPNVILVANEVTLIVFVAKMLSRIPVKIVTSQHNYYDNYEKIGLKQSFVPRFIFPLCYKVIAVSDGIKNMLVNTFKQSPARVVTINNPIDVKSIKKLSDEIITSLPDNYILFVGRFDKVKNIEMLIGAFQIFREKYQDVKLLLIGGGPEQESISKQIQMLEMEKEVLILGIKSNPFPYIKKAKLVALSSVTEAFPTVLLESLVLGKTIVSTPTQGAIDISKNGKYGYLSQSLFNTKDFFDTLIEAYKNPINKDLLISYVSMNYDLHSRVNEIEKIWTANR